MRITTLPTRLQSQQVGNRPGVIQIAIALLYALYLSGCATGPKELGPLFYPSLPNPPRIQHLKTISNVNDLKGSGSNLAAFILAGAANEASIAKPYGLAVDGNKIYVVDTSNNGYGIFDLKENEFRFVMGTGGGGLSKPINIEIDEDGSKYVADTNRMQVVVFDQDDNYARAYGVEGQFKPTDVAMDDDRLYVSDIQESKIHVLDKRTGETLFTFPSDDKNSSAHLAHPTNLALDKGYLYVADSTAARVNKYTTEGEYVMTFGSMGVKPGQFARPKGVAVDKMGNLYVVDAAFDNVQIFSEDGSLLLFFGQAGPERRDLNLPATVVLDYDNHDFYQQYAEPGFNVEYAILVVSQYGNGSINIFGFGTMEGMDYSSESADQEPDTEQN